MDGVNDALLNAAPNAQQAMTLNIAVTSNVVGRTQDLFVSVAHWHSARSA